LKKAAIGSGGACRACGCRPATTRQAADCDHSGKCCIAAICSIDSIRIVGRYSGSPYSLCANYNGFGSI
jgi:hypothetical protein